MENIYKENQDFMIIFFSKSAFIEIWKSGCRMHNYGLSALGVCTKNSAINPQKLLFSKLALKMSKQQFIVNVSLSSRLFDTFNIIKRWEISELSLWAIVRML